MKESFSKGDVKGTFELVLALLRRATEGRGHAAVVAETCEAASPLVGRAWQAFEAGDPTRAVELLREARDRLSRGSVALEFTELCEQARAAIDTAVHRVSNPIWRHRDLGAISDRPDPIG